MSIGWQILIETITHTGESSAESSDSPKALTSNGRVQWGFSKIRNNKKKLNKSIGTKTILLFGRPPNGLERSEQNNKNGGRMPTPDCGGRPARSGNACVLLRVGCAPARENCVGCTKSTRIR
ncbi:hypothetical protein EVAR_13122_1 [Eumeta japonica]|uniref:Uncharacterized protein n=1 Tax=Eumeta variegata TaxID=151549 RepID=A0A4C1U9P3_EUMVA|nr:hypothetical protein EVAR_13122_1 [Eumeta japonica]